MAARAGALVGTVLLLLSILADHGWGPIVKTWSEVAAGTGMVLLGPLWLVDSHLAGTYRKLYVTAGVVAFAAGGLALVMGVLEVTGILR